MPQHVADTKQAAPVVARDVEPVGGRLLTRPTHPEQGVPVGGELDYLDEGTIGAALKARRDL